MSVSVYASCLSRLRLSSTAASAIPVLSRAQASSFHSSAIQQNVVKKKSNLTLMKHRESRSAKIKKKTKDRPRPPAVGERKAARKRIVLSNTNALEVSGLENLSTENMANAGQIGQVLALEGPLLDQLRDVKAFKTTQNWNMFRTPSTLMREESVDLGADIKDVNDSVSNQGLGARTIQKVVTGERGSGKSIHLLQAMSMAFLNKWIVINVPEGQDFVINQSSYSPVPQSETNSSKEQMYIQPQLTSDLLTRVAHSNTEVLSKLKVLHDHGKSLPIKTNKMKSLKDLAMVGSEEPNLAPSIWQALWKELTETPAKAHPSAAPRPPMLIAIDGLDHWMGPSKYRSADYNIIHAHQFTLIKQFIDILFSKNENPLPNGGMVLAATSASNNPVYPTFQVLLRQLAARAQGVEVSDPKFPMPAGYAKVDQHVFGLLQNSSGVGLTMLQGLSRVESKGLLEYFARSGIFKEAVTDTAVSEKWSLSGGGVIGELCKFGKRVRIGEMEIRPNQGTRLRS